MHFDSHYLIGRSHAVCQDFAMHNDKAAALSDGCSCVIDKDGKQTVAHTDLGARILVSSAIQRGTTVISIMPLIELAKDRAYLLRLSDNDMLATIAIISQVDDCDAYAVIMSDGILATRDRKSREWFCLSLKWRGNPYYPIQYFKENFLRHLICESVIGKNYSCVTPTFYAHYMNSKDSDMMIVASDGVFSFSQNGKPIEFAGDFAKRFLDIRRAGGCFIQRHLSGITRELAAEGITHHDDISMVGVYIPES